MHDNTFSRHQPLSVKKEELIQEELLSFNSFYGVQI
jgi:hypothetical protein